MKSQRVTLHLAPMLLAIPPVPHPAHSWQRILRGWFEVNHRTGDRGRRTRSPENELIWRTSGYRSIRALALHAQEIGEFSEEDLVPDEQVVVTMTRKSYVKRIPSATYKPQRRGGKGIIGMVTGCYFRTGSRTSGRCWRR